MQKMRIKFIDNDPNNGIAYDWKLIKKEYKKLGIPAEYDYSEILPLDDDFLKWFILNSERSVGKTTNVLLIGMVMHKLYGTVIQHIRHSAKEQKASYYERLFSTITSYKNGQYIQRLTDGKYNTIVYYHKAFYYAIGEDGKKPEKAPEPFCVALCSADCYTLCSSYESPRGDFILLDECFNESNTPDEFVHFIHLHKTIVRERISDKIFILGNNLDINNVWYRQLTIHNDIRKMTRGQTKIVHTSEGMPIFCAFLENRLPEKRKKFNALHYGFNNPELNSITGSGEWKLKEYPQAWQLGEFERVARGIFFSYHDDLYLEGEFIAKDTKLYFMVHPAAEETAHKGDLLYTMHLPTEKNQLYFGRDKLINLIYNCIGQNRIVYSDNETGNLFEKFLKECE